MAGAANYMYEKASVKGVGYKNVEMIISTQTGFNGQKLVEKESGSCNVITERTELEAERQLNRDYSPIGSVLVPEDKGKDPVYTTKLVPSMEPPGWRLVLVVVDPGRPGVAAHWDPSTCNYPTGTDCPMDYINFTKEAEFEYMPVSYQTGTYDQKWIEKLCVQNYRIGAVLTEMYTHAEHLQKTTEVKTRGYGIDPAIVNPTVTLFEKGKLFYGPYPSDSFDPANPDWRQVYGYNPEPQNPFGPFEGYSDHYRPYVAGSRIDRWGKEGPIAGEVIRPGWTDPAREKLCNPCCTGVLEANLNSNVIGVAHIGWISRDPEADNQLKGRHAEYGRSVEDLTGVFSIEKFIQLWGNSTCGAISVDWLPCV